MIDHAPPRSMGMVLDKDLPEYQVPFLLKVVNLIPSWAPISVEKSVEGMVVRNGKLTLGYRLGPAYDLSGLLHEIGHLIDIDDERVLHYGWGLRLPEIEVMGRMYDQPNTTKPTERECSVIAWQILVGRAVGFEDPDIDGSVRALRFMPDWCLIPKTTEDSLQEWDGARFAWCWERVKAHLRSRTVEDALRELHRKAEVVTKQMSLRETQSPV